MLSLVYVSSATRLLSQAQLIELLHQSRCNNQRNGLTGALLYAAGNFIQAVEGDDDTVLQLEATLKHDARHHLYTRLLAVPIQERAFPTWTMAFRCTETLSTEDRAVCTDLLGYEANLDTVAKPACLEAVAVNLIRNFRDSMHQVR